MLEEVLRKCCCRHCSIILPWYYFNQQNPSEPLVFKQFGSKAIDEGGTTLAHSAFVDAEFAEDPARESMEITMFAFVLEDKLWGYKAGITG